MTVRVFVRRRDRTGLACKAHAGPRLRLNNDAEREQVNVGCGEKIDSVRLQESFVIGNCTYQGEVKSLLAPKKKRRRREGRGTLEQNFFTCLAVVE